MMKIGDQVSVIDEDLVGVITSVRGDMVTIKDNYGFTHQYPQQALVYQQTDLYDGMTIKDKYEYTPPKSKKHQKNTYSVDLHFNKIVPDPERYESYERLFLQKEKLIEAIDFCKAHRIKRLEVIHGIGDGTLQQMVKDTLEGQVGLSYFHQDILYHQSGAVVVEFV